MVRDYERGPAPHPLGPGPVWQPGRYPSSPIPPDDEATQNKRPSGIYEALRKTCMVPVKHYFLATILEDGQFTTFTSPPGIPRHVTDRFFDEEEFHKVFGAYKSGASSSSLENSDGSLLSPPQGGPPFFSPPTSSFSFGSAPHDNSRRMQQRRQRPSYSNYGYEAMYNDDYLNSPMSPKMRKGLRGQRFRTVGGGASSLKEEEEVPTVKAPARKRPIKVSEAQELWNFYEQRFKNCQQTACKVIAKAWVKAIAPKKQSHNPYTGKDSTAPAWWPKPWGPGDTDKVRHKEPDHLYKKERVYLLNHLLRLIMTPAEDHPAEIRKLDLSINVRKLEEVTADALAAFYADGQNPTNAGKKIYVDEIFKVAKAEERYRHGEVDGDTEVYVMADDKPTDGYQSDNEDTTPTRSLNNGGPGSASGGAGGQGSNSNPPSRVSPTNPTVTAMPVQNMLQQPPSSAEHSPTTSIPSGSSYLSDISSIRNQQPPPPPPSSAYSTSHPHSMMHSDLGSADSSNQSYVDSAAASMTLNMPPPLHSLSDLNTGHHHHQHHHHHHHQHSAHDSARRPSSSLLSSSGYSTSSNSTLYSTQWQPASTSPTGTASSSTGPPPPLQLPPSSSMYTYTHSSPTVNPQQQHSPYGATPTQQSMGSGLSLGVGVQTMSPQTISPQSQQGTFLNPTAFDSMPQYEPAQTTDAAASMFGRPPLGPHTTSFHGGYPHMGQHGQHGGHPGHGQQPGDGRRLHGVGVGPIKTEDLSPTHLP